MTHEQATALLATLEAEKRIEAAIVATRTRGAVVQHYAVKILLRQSQRFVTLRQLDAWPSVQQAWDLSA